MTPEQLKAVRDDAKRQNWQDIVDEIAVHSDWYCDGEEDGEICWRLDIVPDIQVQVFRATTAEAFRLWIEQDVRHPGGDDQVQVRYAGKAFPISPDAASVLLRLSSDQASKTLVDKISEVLELPNAVDQFQQRLNGDRVRLMDNIPALVTKCKEILEFLDNRTPIHPSSHLHLELRGIVGAIEGKEIAMRHRSCAKWGPIPGFPNGHTSTDEHDTEEQALAVCRGLERMGRGGEGVYFPIKTWVEPIAPFQKTG